MYTKDSELGMEVLEEVREMEVMEEIRKMEERQEMGER